MSGILAVTLCRGGSKGVPGKHTRLLCGKPVLWYTIQAVQSSWWIDDYVISSDDPAVLEIAEEYGVDTIRRPEELARDDTPTLPALQHAVHTYDPHKFFKYIIEVRATSPLKTVQDIDGVIKTLMDNDRAESVIGVTELGDHHPMRAKWLDEDGYIHDFLPEPESGRRQDCKPTAYIRNGTVYALCRSAMYKLFGHKHSLGYVMPWDRSINIDTELDFRLCELLMLERNAS